MALIKDLQKEKITFMKAKEAQKVEVINEILTTAKTFAVNKKEPNINNLADEEVFVVIKKIQKQLTKDLYMMNFLMLTG